MRRVLTVALGALVGSAAGGCGGTEPAGGTEAEAVSFAGIADFELTDAEADPWAEHRPEPVFCSALTGWYLEGDVIEVDTTHCTYFSAHAPSLAAGQAGDLLVAEVSHFDLTAAEPATAHLALTVGERAVWEREVQVPGPADVLAVRADLPIAVAEGTQVTWHLHNHGQNNWRLSEVKLHAR